MRFSRCSARRHAQRGRARRRRDILQRARSRRSHVHRAPEGLERRAARAAVSPPSRRAAITRAARPRRPAPTAEARAWRATRSSGRPPSRPAPAGPPDPRRQDANAAHGGDASGKDCIVAGCHLDARPWAFGGTLYTDAAGTARTANAEIRITGPDGKVYASTYSDVDGNFWFETGTPKVPAGQPRRRAHRRQGDGHGRRDRRRAGRLPERRLSRRRATPGKVFLK